MERKRPEGRQKYVTNNSKGVHRRGEGLGTGPVGNTGKAGGSGGSGGGNRTTRSGGMNPMMLIIVALVVMLGGGGGLFGALNGGSGDTGLTAASGYEETTVVTAKPAATQTPATPKPAASSQAADTSVAAEARAKYTAIQGGGQDTVNIMIYMCGTDLESRSAMATRDLTEMTRANLSDQVNILVYTGGCTKWNNQIISSQVNQIYQVVSGGLKLLESNMGADAMTKPSTLSTFIQWCGKNYPADRNELIFWDHGGGSVSGYGYDEKNQRAGSMRLSGIQQALRDGGMKFDFIGFDACLMATVETGLMLDEFADYMVASEETEPGIGWYYTDWLTALSNNTSMATVEMGKNIVDGFVETCAVQCRGQSATLSVVDLAELSATVPAPLKKFSESLSTMIADKEYAAISTARGGTREYAQSSRIDQIDLMDFAQRLGNDEGAALAASLKGAVKYNRASADMAKGSNGLSIYFPYRKASTVDSAVSTYDAIGMDESYSQCIREFAALEVSGQVATGGTGSPLPSLLGQYSGSSGSSDMIGSLLGSFLGGDYSSISGLSGSNVDFFDAGALKWTKNSQGQDVIALPEDQWDLVEDVVMNMFFDDGEGYVDLGTDNLLDYDDAGNLIGATDRTWLAVNGQPVAYYHEFTEDGVTQGYIPAMLDGVRVELLVVFDDENPRGAITGARTVYPGGETDTVAKSTEALEIGSTIEFLCDYYTYDGDYQNTYYLGEPMEVTETMEISNVDVGEGEVQLTYRFSDIYQQQYWTPALTG